MIKHLNRTKIVALALILVGILGIAKAAELWIIDSTDHYITVQPVEGYMEYSPDNATWYNTTSVTAGTPWYARLQIKYTGPATSMRIDWELLDPSGWTALTTFNTVVVLAGGWQTIYVSPTAGQTDNYNWGQQTMTVMAEFDYRVRARVSET